MFEGENASGRGYRDLNLTWLDNHKLEIGFCDGTIDKVSPSAMVVGRLLEVRLIRERSGGWPASIPPERRGPEPPCI